MKFLKYVMFIVVYAVTSVAIADTEFPNRKLFPETTPISLEDLKVKKDQALIVDVRSQYEFDTLHIKGARHVPLGIDEFMSAVLFKRDHAEQPIVFYCNGKTCKKSYKAALTAAKEKVKNVYVFDAGIFEWAKAFPAESILLGKPMESVSKLIPTSKLKAHMLDHKTFMKSAREDNAIILDIRDPVQREGLQIFAHRENTVPLDNKKMQKYVDLAKSKGKTLMVYDAVGKQVRWLQYYLEDQGVENYYFMKGGADTYFEDFIAQYRKKL
jgi:rhodanese-related sulfurtransferase